MGVRTHLGAAVILGIAGSAVGQVFYEVGVAPGHEFSRVHAISADGRVAAGGSFLNVGAGSYPGFTWTQQGRNDFGLDAGLPHETTANALSQDGSVVVGTAAASFETLRAYVYRGPGTLQTLGTLGYQRSFGTGVSGDGSVVVGYVEAGPVPGIAGQPFRWTQSGGMQGLGYARPWHDYGEARGISRDGGTIVGWSRGASGVSNAFAWTEGAGMQVLPDLPGTTSGSLAYATNVTGDIIVGVSGAPRNAVLWQNGQPISLGLIPGFTSMYPNAVDDLGNTIVGHLDPITGSDVAGIWTSSRGMERLADYLAFQGVPVPTGWQLWDCTSVSSDGQVFGGWGRSPSGVFQGFVAVVPAPAGAFVLLASLFRALPRRRRE